MGTWKVHPVKSYEIIPTPKIQLNWEPPLFLNSVKNSLILCQVIKPPYSKTITEFYTKLYCLLTSKGDSYFEKLLLLLI